MKDKAIEFILRIKSSSNSRKRSNDDSNLHETELTSNSNNLNLTSNNSSKRFKPECDPYNIDPNTDLSKLSPLPPNNSSTDFLNNFNEAGTSTINYLTESSTNLPLERPLLSPGNINVAINTNLDIYSNNSINEFTKFLCTSLDTYTALDFAEILVFFRCLQFPNLIDFVTVIISDSFSYRRFIKLMVYIERDYDLLDLSSFLELREYKGFMDLVIIINKAPLKTFLKVIDLIEKMDD